MATKKLGIHVAPGALKIVEVEQQDKNLKVLNYSIDYFPLEAKAETIAKTLISSLKNNKIHTKEAHLVLLGSDIIYKLIELPELPEKDLASAVKYKLKAVLPLSFKEVVFDYYKIEKLQGKENKHLYFVAAAPAEKISAMMGIIKAAGLSLRDIIAPSCALKNAAGALGPEPGAIIYLGKYSSLIILVKDGQVVFAREAKIGGNDITQAMVGVVQTEQGKLELDYKQAEEIKNRYGIPIDLEQYSAEAGVPAAALLEMMRPALEKISAEILSTFDYYRTEIGDAAEFKKVYFSGGVSKTKNLVEYLKKQLGLEIELALTKGQSAKEEFAADAPFLSLALGALIPGKDHLSLLPRKSEWLFVGDFTALFVNQFKKWFRFIFWGLLFLLALELTYGWFYVQAGKLSDALKSLQKEHQARLAEIGKKAEEAKGIVDLLKYSRKDRFALVMQKLDKDTPPDIFFSKINYDNNAGQAVLAGIVLEDHGKRSMANFIEILKRSRYFKLVNLIYLQESEAYTTPTYEFELKCILAGEAKK